jgi:hypothetical protein
MSFQKDYSLIRLSLEHDIKPFDCGDTDLNDFFLNDSKPHLAKLLAVTYVLEKDDVTIAFFSLLNDKISIEDSESKRSWFRSIVSATGKKYKSHPAMKIGRLGVNSTIQSCGTGSMIIDYLKPLFITNNRTGCRYITVDAYSNSINFYLKNGFEFMTSSDQGKDTRLMYFDLMKMVTQ